MRDIHGMIVTQDYVFLSCNNTLYRISIENPKTKMIFPGKNIGRVPMIILLLLFITENNDKIIEFVDVLLRI